MNRLLLSLIMNVPKCLFGGADRPISSSILIKSNFHWFHSWYCQKKHWVENLRTSSVWFMNESFRPVLWTGLYDSVKRKIYSRIGHLVFSLFWRCSSFVHVHYVNIMLDRILEQTDTCFKTEYICFKGFLCFIWFSPLHMKGHLMRV